MKNQINELLFEQSSEEETFEETVILSGKTLLGRSIVNETDDPEIGFLFRYLSLDYYIQ